MFGYNISFSDMMHTSKPTGAEISRISNSLTAVNMDYRELASAVGEYGCSFCPAVYDGKRREENFKSQQLIGLDFDNGITFEEVKQKSEHYHLNILFAYCSLPRKTQKIDTQNAKNAPERMLFKGVFHCK